VAAKVTIAATPVAAPSPYDEHYQTIAGSALKAFATSRDVAVTLHPHGAIKTINANTADRSAAIIGGLIKLLAGFAAPSPDAVPVTACNDETKRALTDHQRLTATIRALQHTLASGSPAQAPEIAKQLTALSTEVARLETGPLQIKLKRTLRFDHDSTGGVIAWQDETFGKWFGTKAQDGNGDVININGADMPIDGKDIPNFQVAYCITRDSQKGSDACNAEDAVQANQTQFEPATIACPTEDCSKTIVFREPVMANLVFVPVGTDLGEQGKKLHEAKLPVAQFGEFSYLPLEVGFGGSETVALTLDEFGRRSTLSWKSGALGEGIVSGLTTISDAVASEEAIEQKALEKEVSRLETQQKLNKLERCRSIIEAGGFECPDE
jgi:hypothetical protein